MNKQNNPKKHPKMTPTEAEKYLKKLDEWNDVAKMDKDVIVKWAMFLKSKEEQKTT